MAFLLGYTAKPSWAIKLIFSFSVLIFGMATLLLFGIASTKEEEFSSFIKRISKPKEQTPPSDEVSDPTAKIIIKPKEEIQLPGDENTGTTAL